MSLKFNKDKVYSMPVFFGPSWCQQQPWEGGKTMNSYYQPGDNNVVAISYETDREVLEQYIPECYTLNAPIVTVIVNEFRNLGWLNGKTYSLININVPVHFKGERDDLDGDLVLAMFENHSDPIVGGRETMGYAKLYCDIPPIQHNESKYIAKASAWDFTFMKLEIDTSKPAADAKTVQEWEAKSEGKVHYKYIPDVMEKGEDPENNFKKAAIEYPTILPKWTKPDDYPYEIRTPEVQWCDGTIEFYEPQWGDWPTNGGIGAGLASLKPKKILAAKHLLYSDPCYYATCYKLK